MSIQIDLINQDHRPEWEEYINSIEHSSFVDYFAWREAIEKVYGLKHYWYTAKAAGDIKGILALTLTKHPIFGTYLSTAPFGSRGGFYAENETVENALLRRAEELRRELNVKYILIRHLQGDKSPPTGWYQNPIYNSSRIPLQNDPDSMLKNHMKSDARNQIKKSLKREYNYSLGSRELLDDFWYVMIRSMKYLGSPYHSKEFLITLFDLFGDNLKIIVVYNKNHMPLAAASIFRHNKTISPLHAGILRKNDASYIGVYLYWSMIELYCPERMNWLDLGRSLVNSSQEHFKKKFNPIQEKLAYWFILAKKKTVPNLNQSNPMYDIPRKLWGIMPLPVQKTVGPYLIKGIL
jgi:serine/alanine adding enzyme